MDGLDEFLEWHGKLLIAQIVVLDGCSRSVLAPLMKCLEKLSAIPNA
jgi:hypothetical protein